MQENVNQKFLESILNVLQNAQRNAKTAVNLSMVYAYFEVGRMIVEEEQHGENRAKYGEKVLTELSDYLTLKIGKGFSVTNLKQMRQFYSVYSNDKISQTVSDQFKNLPTVSTGRRFFLSWSHYLKLMRIENIDERHFYEIEAAKNDWSLRELNRQFDSALYERLALSTDKNDSMVELTLPKNSNIYASKYQLYLPNKEQLQKKLKEWSAELSQNEKQ